MNETAFPFFEARLEPTMYILLSDSEKRPFAGRDFPLEGLTVNKKSIPKPVITRYLNYLTRVRYLRKRNLEWVSSQELARSLRLTSSTVRQDLTHIKYYGVPNQGYETRGLEKALMSVFREADERKMLVVGAGNLGKALALYSEFRKRGFVINGIIDSNPQIAGKRIGDLVVEGLESLPDMIEARDIEIGIIAVPAKEAQRVADQLILSGIKGILNLSSAQLVAPEKIPVVELKIIDSLDELAFAILNQ